VKDKNIFHC